MLKRLCLSALCIILLCSCMGDIENEFCSLRAFCRITPVTGAAPLHEALNNPGLFCTLTAKGSLYTFTRQNGTSVPLDMGAMGQSYLPLQTINNLGLILGTPSVPDVRTTQFYTVAFDIVCPNCYDNAITKQLYLQDETAVCNRCKRHYDLRNNGIVIEGGKGRKLFRYRMTYTPAQDVVVISN